MSYNNYDTICLCIFLLAGVSEIERFPSLIRLSIHFNQISLSILSCPGARDSRNLYTLTQGK